jgi:hypothetical protein
VDAKSIRRYGGPWLSASVRAHRAAGQHSRPTPYERLHRLQLLPRLDTSFTGVSR